MQLRQYWDTMLAEGAQRGLNSNSSGYRSTAAAIQSCAESIRRLSGGDSASISCIGTAAFRLCAHSESGVDGEARQALQRLCGPFLGLGSVSIQVLTGKWALLIRRSVLFVATLPAGMFLVCACRC